MATGDDEKRNASQHPRIFYARHMQPGICKYENEVVLVDTDALKNMIPTGVAIPVYINHQKVDLSKMKEQAAGYVTESFYNELDGWAWFKFIAVDDECHIAIQDGWHVSNAYIGDEFAAGGTKNNCPYDREILNGHFTHLAIVQNPRYEEACIMSPEQFKEYQEKLRHELKEHQNSKPEPKGKTMKLFNFKKELAAEVTDETVVEIGDGQTATFAEMRNALTNAKKKNEAEPEPEMANGDTEVDLDGEKMPLKELVNRYNALRAKNSKEEEEKANAEAEEKKKEEEKENAKKAEEMKHFEELRNAHEKVKKSEVRIESPASALQRGRDRY